MKGAKVSELTISRTQILDYLNCGYRWDLNYRRGIESTKLRESMDVGSAVHMAIRYAVVRYANFGGTKWTARQEETAVAMGTKAWAEGEVKWRGEYLTLQQEEEIRAIEADAQGIALKALQMIQLPEWEVARYNRDTPFCEVEVVTPLPPWKGFRTIPDLVARRRSDGKKAPFWLIDWKTRGSFEDDDAEEINLQFATMQYVLAKELPAIPIEGSILWQVKSAQPRTPTLNKDGSMSRAAIVSDWETYKRALVEAKLNPADYADMKDKLAQVEWFRAIVQHRTHHECEKIWLDIVCEVAERMALDPQVIRRWSYTPFACKGCWAKEFCLAELRNDDTEFLLQTDYMDTHNPRERLETGTPRRNFTLSE